LAWRLGAELKGLHRAQRDCQDPLESRAAQRRISDIFTKRQGSPARARHPAFATNHNPPAHGAITHNPQRFYFEASSSAGAAAPLFWPTRKLTILLMSIVATFEVGTSRNFFFEMIFETCIFT
jgi:hypothetical protein